MREVYAERLFRSIMCTLCALLFVINSRGPQRASAEGVFSPPGADEPPAGAQISELDRRLIAQRPELDPASWELALYGRGSEPLEDEPVTVRVEGVSVDQRIAEPLRAMLSDARSQGLHVYLSCGYTDRAAQEHICRRCAERYGETAALAITGRPDENEHRSGLAVDIADRWYEDKDESIADTELFAWLSEHCCEYGFILRYPEGKKELTGHVFEPWHFRYVGVEAARFMTANGLTLEEFLELYRY